MKIGIMPEPLVRARMVAIAKGQYSATKDEPKLWFSSINAVAQVLRTENIDLLRLIKDRNPQSMTELAKLSGRQKSNLSTTLKSLSLKGFVKLEKMPSNRVKPIALHTDFEIISNSATDEIFR